MDFPGNDLPGNSHTSRKAEPKPESPAPSVQTEEAPKKIVTGKVRTGKEPIVSRLKTMFIADGGSFMDHLVENVVVPMVKDIALSIVTQSVDGFRQGVEQKLFGESRPRSSVRSSYGSHVPVNYSRYSANSAPTRSTAIRGGASRPVSRPSNQVQIVILDTREEADLVLEELDAMIDSVRHCTVGDYYDLVGLTPQSTDDSWGWTDLSRARVNKVGHDEFQISMPRPKPIDNGR